MNLWVQILDVDDSHALSFTEVRQFFVRCDHAYNRLCIPSIPLPKPSHNVLPSR
jgi:hypothetical protein